MDPEADSEIECARELGIFFFFFSGGEELAKTQNAG
jgi:hypothetical protein